MPGMKWGDFFKRLLTLKTPDEIEKGLRESFAAGELKNLTADGLEYRITQMRRLAGERPPGEVSMATCEDGLAHGFAHREEGIEGQPLCAKNVQIVKSDDKNPLVCEACLPLMLKELAIEDVDAFMGEVSE